MTNTAPKKLGYVPALDGLRAIALLLIMLVHAHFYLGKNGQLPVSIFFTLSGFLITTLLLEEFDKNGDVSFKGFYIRRTMRLFPALYSMLLFVMVYTLFFKSSADQSVIYKEVLSAAFYVNNISWKWGWGNDAVLLGHTWTLAVEEQFYLVWPFILVFLVKRKFLKSVQYGLIIFIIMSWIFKSKEIYPDIVSSMIQESTFIGSLAAILRWNYGNIKIPQFLALLLMLASLIIGIMPFSIPFSLYNIGAIFTIIIILALMNDSNTVLNKFLSAKPMVFVGKMSYSLYLWHVIVFKLFTWHSTLPPTITFILKFVVTFLVALVSWYLIEQKATAIGRKWSKKIENKQLA